MTRFFGRKVRTGCLKSRKRIVCWQILKERTFLIAMFGWTKFQQKLFFFAWEATWGKVLTLDRLQRRGWQLPNQCFLCGCEEETINTLYSGKRVVEHHSCVVWCTMGLSKICKGGS